MLDVKQHKLVQYIVWIESIFSSHLGNIPATSPLTSMPVTICFVIWLVKIKQGITHPICISFTLYLFISTNSDWRHRSMLRFISISCGNIARVPSALGGNIPTTSGNKPHH